jgi:hypothetical protein
MSFGYPFEFRVSAGLVLVIDFHPNRCSVRVRVSTLGFDFGYTETPSDPLPSLVPQQISRDTYTHSAKALATCSLICSYASNLATAVLAI